MKNIFEESVTKEVIERINQLTNDSQPIWGKMNVGQMLAHCNVMYEMVYDNIHPKAKGFKKLLLKLFVKPMVVGPAPYKRNLRTAPAFLITDERDFETEKNRLIKYLEDTQALGGRYFHMKESNSFGFLTENEWNVMFYKHIDHHLQQFGV
ncbi:DUF1569 domain-containing protein [Membranihabitans marinus]|uniref:DUF1569 domain-containing protein n=1 Tax=Membranihabitans marinus TaxID=1227546 RepID=UPI001F229D0B|nr:DUF1569 domain-containing protein [Membranihabitans marinus]